MGDYLTFADSKSLAYQFDDYGTLIYPDENYAREVMELFTIGLYALADDGTKLLDAETGDWVETYDNDDSASRRVVSRPPSARAGDLLPSRPQS